MKSLHVPIAEQRALAALIDRTAIVEGDFTLASGEKASWKIDLEIPSNTDEGKDLFGKALLSMLTHFPSSYDVCALAGGGIPLVAATVELAQQRGTYLHPVTFRKEPVHGNWLDGGVPAGRSVILIDDVITKGTTIRRAALELASIGIPVAGALVIIDREPTAPKVFDGGLPFFTALDIGDLTPR